MTMQMRMPAQSARSARRWITSSSTLLALVALSACQTYERAPLDLREHRATSEARLRDIEPIEAFAQRLREADALASTSERFDPSDGLSSAEGEVLALFYNPRLRIARLEAGVTRATQESAGLWQDPELGFDGAEVLSPGGPFEYGLTLRLTIPISGRLQAAKEHAATAHAAKLHEIAAAEWSTRAEARRAWAAWSAAQERVRLLREMVEQVERVQAITDRLETAGELARIEGRLFRVESAGRRSTLTEAELDAHRARYELLAIMGLPPYAEIELLPAFPVVAAPTPVDAMERMIESNPMLAVRRAAYQTAEEALRLEIRKQYPDFTIGPGYGSEENDDRLLLGFSIPIPLLNANRGGIGEARAQREVARAAAEMTFEMLTHQLAAATAQLEAVRGLRVRHEAEIVPMLAEQSTEVERIAELGEVDTLLLIETISRQFEAKSRLLDLRVLELNAVITLAELLGPETGMDGAPISSGEETP